MWYVRGPQGSRAWLCMVSSVSVHYTKQLECACVQMKLLLFVPDTTFLGQERQLGIKNYVQ